MVRENLQEFVSPLSLSLNTFPPCFRRFPVEIYFSPSTIPLPVLIFLVPAENVQ